MADSPLVDGLRAGTARPSDRPDETGDNVVLFGPDGQPLARMVEVDAVILFRYNGETKTARCSSTGSRSTPPRGRIAR